jgi:hypothetical protein
VCSYFISGRYMAMLACAAVALAGALCPKAVAEEQDPARPTLAVLMTLTQLRHFKLWYATRVDNWQLAAYELQQFETTIDRIVKLYPAVSTIPPGNLIHDKTDPAMTQLRSAITDRNRPRFEAAYMKITNACNECHQAAGVSFIKVQVPTRSPFSNQNFQSAR